MKKLILVIIILLGVIAYLGLRDTEVREVIKEIPVEKIITQNVTVEKIVTQNITIEVPVEKIVTQNVTIEKEIITYRPTKEWQSLEELETWFRDNLVYLGNPEADCDNYARYFQREAYKDGYFLSCQLVLNGYLNNVKVTNNPSSHMGIIAFVGNEIYYIEPNPQDYHITYVCPLD